MAPYIPSLLAVFAAFLFALSAHFQSLGLNGENEQAASLIIVLTTAAIFWLITPFVVAAEWWLTTATLLFALSGLLRPTISVSLWTHGIRTLGPTLNAGLGASGPIFTAIFAYLIVGEHMTWPIAIGTVSVMLGILVASTRSRSSRINWPVWAISLPVGAELCRAIAHSMTKVGFDDVPSAFFASLVAATVGAVMLSLRYVTQGRSSIFHTVGSGWFMLSGTLNCAAILALNVALHLGQVIAVTPIVSSSPVFAMLLGLLIFRREQFTWRTFATIGLVVPGVILISLAQ
ncbi:MAG: DMT family transporter [Hyphomicrobiaceae bacterium]